MLRSAKTNTPPAALGAGESLDRNALTGNLKPTTARSLSPRAEAAAETEERCGRKCLDGLCETARDGKEVEQGYQIVAVGAPRTPYAPSGALPSHQAPDSRTANRTGSCGTRGDCGATLPRSVVVTAVLPALLSVPCPGSRGPHFLSSTLRRPSGRRSSVMTECIMRERPTSRQPYSRGGIAAAPEIRIASQKYATLTLLRALEALI